MATQTETRPDVRAVAAWASLLRGGAQPDVPVPRRLWRQAVRAAAGVSSAPSIRDHTHAARDAGLIEVEHGAGSRKGTVTLIPPGRPGQFVPGFTAEDLAELAGMEQPVTA